MSETCPNTDKYLNMISSQNIAATGVQRADDIIIEINYPLIIALTSILIFTVVMVIATISWCISKKWSIKKAKLTGYRKLQMQLDIEHKASSYDVGNDFLTYQEPDPEKREKEEEEDDLDHINLDIHQDIMEAGQEYLRIFESHRDKRKGDQKSKRDRIFMQIKEIEDIL